MVRRERREQAITANARWERLDPNQGRLPCQSGEWPAEICTRETQRSHGESREALLSLRASHGPVSQVVPARHNEDRAFWLQDLATTCATRDASRPAACHY